MCFGTARSQEFLRVDIRGMQNPTIYVDNGTGYDGKVLLKSHWKKKDPKAPQTTVQALQYFINKGWTVMQISEKGNGPLPNTVIWFTKE